MNVIPYAQVRVEICSMRTIDSACPSAIESEHHNLALLILTHKPSLITTDLAFREQLAPVVVFEQDVVAVGVPYAHVDLGLDADGDRFEHEALAGAVGDAGEGIAGFGYGEVGEFLRISAH